MGYRGGQLARLTVTQDSPAATNTPVPAECNANDAQGCTETFVYRQDGVPLELLYTPAKNNLTQRYWYEMDAHGSVVALTDSSGQVVQRYVYGPWGDLIPLLSGPELVPQPLRYRGYVYDRELAGRAEASGWYWLGVRSYDPNIGRFIQPDPSEQEGTRTYVYCGDAPLDCSDPSSLLSLEDVGNVVFAVGVGLAVVGVAATGVGLVAEAAGFSAVGAFSMATLVTAGPVLATAGAKLITGDPEIYGGGLGALGDMGGVSESHIVPEGETGAVQSEGAVPDGSGARKPLVEGEVGRFGDLDARRVKGDDLTPHHMPQAAQHFTSREDGAAVMMRAAQHEQTRSFFGAGRIPLQQEAGLPFRSVLARDLWDYRQIEPQRARDVIPAVLEYYRANFPQLIAKP